MGSHTLAVVTQTAPGDRPAAPSPRDRPHGLRERLTRFVDSAAKGSNILTSVLLGAVSLLIAFTAFQASQYSDEAARLDSVANRISVDTINQYQDAYAQNQTDIQVWLQIVASGQSVDESPLAAILSPGFLDAIERDQARKGTTDSGKLVLPTDDRYWDELTVSAQSKNDQLEQAYYAARTAGSISARLTGATVIYSAALLLLTLGASSGRHGTRLALSGAAAAIIVVAILIGAAPVRWFE
jgi:hypothetical protein